ncbi:MAG: D-glycero-beta-D-manno-heptose-7-phosphate kinase [Candidatus Omnitrophica bacterium]|nr:D-glycero-beta-D-manno-heptose-7-phosphate kinase [Candidatus Omnitrophota bacterium]
MDRLKKIISNFKNSNILIVGDLILDEYISGNVDKISPEAPVPVVWAKKRNYMPGGACNVASNISSLGAKVSIIGVVGWDVNAEILLAELKNRNIDTSGILKDSKRPTTLKTRIVAQHQQVVRVDWEGAEGIYDSLTTKIASFIKKNMDRFDAIIIEDYGKGVITSSLLRKIASFVSQKKKLITVDPKEDHFGMYKDLKITAITPNRKETENAIRNIKIADENNKLKIKSDKLKTKKDIIMAGRDLLRYLDSQAVLITLGEEGMRLFQKKSPDTPISTVAQEVFDVSGAGDTVIAVFTLALASGANMLEAAYISNYAAGIVVGKVGVATTTQAELLNRIKLKKSKGN